MSQRRRGSYAETDGALALDYSEPRDYREATERYGKRNEQPAPRPVPVAKPRARGWLALIVLVFFIGAFFVLIRQIEIERNILDLATLRTTLKEETARGESLQVELSLKMDVENVQRTATEEMMMKYPDVEMARVVDLPPIKTHSTLDMAGAQEPQERKEEPMTLSSWIAGIREMLGE